MQFLPDLWNDSVRPDHPKYAWTLHILESEQHRINSPSTKASLHTNIPQTTYRKVRPDSCAAHVHLFKQLTVCRHKQSMMEITLLLNRPSVHIYLHKVGQRTSVPPSSTLMTKMMSRRIIHPLPPPCTFIKQVATLCKPPPDQRKFPILCSLPGVP